MSLLQTLEVSEIAFRWGGVTRVYKCDSLRVLSEEDAETIVYADGSRDVSFQGVWLSYRVRANYHQRVSPDASAGNDWTDLLNALQDGAVSVDFYPLYSIDNTLFSSVILSPESRREMLSVERSLFVPSIGLEIEEKARRNDYPEWLRVTRKY